MRRFFLWVLPLTASLAAIVVFASGFYLGVRGGAGTPVSVTTGPVAARSPNGPLQFVILGDSVARGTGDATGLGIGGNLDRELRSRRIAHKPPVNLAVNGARTKDLLTLLESHSVQTIVAQSDLVIISIGGNDLFGAAAMSNRERRPIINDPENVMSEVAGHVEQVVRRVRSIRPQGRIVFIGLYNPFVKTVDGALVSRAVAEWNARLLRMFEGDPQFTLLQTSDLFSHHDRLSVDRFHPGQEGYALIARRIAEGM